MSNFQKAIKCAHCSGIILWRKQCYEGACYCSDCFTLYSSYKTCTSCNQRKRILTTIEHPECQSCRLKKTPCIRCKKISYSIGKITPLGPVCNSCSAYFREQRSCISCYKTNKTVSNRIDDKGHQHLLCQSCHNRKLPLCSKCKYRKPPFIYDLFQQPICKVCAIEGSRYCKHCNKSIPAGYGHQCIECSSRKTIRKRTLIGEKLLSKAFSEVFLLFSKWLEKRRGTEGIVFTATHILKYLDYFLELDKLAIELNQLPNYKEVVEKFSVAQTRKYLLVTIFLNELNIIPIDNSIKEEYSNLGMIDRLLGTFKNDTTYNKIILDYYNYLLLKKKKKASIRSIRLALGQAVSLISWCEHFSLEYPSNELLHGFLWHSPGRKAGITGFINYVNKKYHRELSFPDDDKLIFTRPKKSNKYLELKLLSLLREVSGNINNKETILRTAVEYLHRIQVPKYVWLQGSSIKKNKNGFTYISLVRNKLYIPDEIISLFIKPKQQS